MSCSPESLHPSHSEHSNELQEYDQMYEVLKDGKNKTYVCKIPECNKVFRYKSEIYRHVATHSAQRPYICNFESCKKTFKRNDALENHMRTHTKESPFICEHEECGLTFTTKASLRYHLLKHKDEKTFKCTFPGCTKAFITSFQLKQHEKSSCVHQKVKNFIRAPQLQESDIPAIQAPIPKKIKTEIIVKETVPRTESPEQEKLSQIQAQIQVQAAPQGQNQEIYQHRIGNILTENEVLKQRLELSQKIIGLLQYKMQGEPVSGPEYLFANRFPENLMRLQFLNHHLLDHQQQNY